MAHVSPRFVVCGPHGLRLIRSKSRFMFLGGLCLQDGVSLRSGVITEISGREARCSISTQYTCMPGASCYRPTRSTAHEGGGRGGWTTADDGTARLDS